MYPLQIYDFLIPTGKFEVLKSREYYYIENEAKTKRIGFFFEYLYKQNKKSVPPIY